MKGNVPDSRGDRTPHYRTGARPVMWLFCFLVAGLVVILTLAHLDTARNVGYAAATTTQSGVYVGAGDGSLYKLDANQGVLQWRFQTQGRTIPAPAVVAGGTVYLGSSDNNVYALDAKNGTKLWQFQTGAPVLASPTVNGGVVYIGSSDSNIYALDAKTGNKLWSYHAGQPNEAVTPTTAVVTGGVVYASSSDGVSHSYLFALDAKTGVELWRAQVNDQLFTNPQVDNGVIYIASSALDKAGGPSITDSYIYAFSTKDGSQLWRSGKISDVILAAPAVASGVVYFGSRNDNVYALDAGNGTELWHHNTGGAVFASPQVANSVVYVGMSGGGADNNSIVALNSKDGSMLWRHAVTNYAGANIVVNSNVIYVGSSDSVVYALKATNGSQAWKYKDSAPFTNAPLAVAP
jgi:outer membrane protein assembly factor BamB